MNSRILPGCCLLTATILSGCATNACIPGCLSTSVVTFRVWKKAGP